MKKKKKLADYTPKELKEMSLKEQSDLFEEAIVKNLRQVKKSKKENQ